MPRVNIYIRNEDYAKWQSIPNKPEFIHEVIAEFHVVAELPPGELKRQAELLDENLTSNVLRDRINRDYELEQEDYRHIHES